MIGHHLVGRLLDAGHHIYGVDSFYTGSESNIGKWRGNGMFHFINLDVTSPEIGYVFAKVPVDEVYHLACPASPVHYQRDPVYTIRTAFLGTQNALAIAGKESERPRVLIASTSEVYGDPLEHPQRESYWGNVNTLGPRSCYDEGKRVAESLAYAVGFDVRVARIFNTYGPNMAPDDGRVVSNFIIQSLRKEPITIYGDGTHSRSFGYVSDTVDGLIRLMEHDRKGETSCFVMNIGNPQEFTVKELADVVRMLVWDANGPDHVFRPLPKDDPARRCPDISLARNTLGWEPRVPLVQGVGMTIQYFRQLLGL